MRAGVDRKVLQFAQWCNALEVLGKKLKSTSKARKMLLASGRGKHVGRAAADQWGRKSRAKKRPSRASNLVGTVLAADD
jgi:hypothetical protein